jgi:hypothetical protein
MIWQTFICSFFLNNKNEFKNKIGSMLSCDNLSELNNLYINEKYNLETHNYDLSKFHKSKYKNSGYDLRINETIQEDKTYINNITRYFHIIEIINIIESENVSNDDKINIIDNYNNDIIISKYAPNINARNLMDDW